MNCGERVFIYTVIFTQSRGQNIICLDDMIPFNHCITFGLTTLGKII